MFDLFTSEEQFNAPRIYFPEFDYIRRTYLKELANVVDFYHNRVYAVKSNHFLSTLLYHINVPLHYSVDRFVEVTLARAPHVAAVAKMTSEIRYGEIFDGVFFGSGCQEIILYEEEYFNPFQVEKNWERIAAVRIVNHPKSDLGLLLPNGRQSGTGDGLAVISINVALLVFQYRCFLLKQKNRIGGDGGHLGPSHFIYMYVLPNMLYSQIDITIMNRLMNLLYDAPMGSSLLRHPFMVTNYSHKVDHVLEKVLKLIKTRPERFEAMLQQIPTIASNNMREALNLPEVAPTRQVFWALMISRLNMINFLIDIATPNSLSQNRSEINRLKYTLRQLKNSHIYENMLSGDLLYDTNQVIDKILSV